METARKKIFIGYVPVVHKGVVDTLINQKFDEFYVLSVGFLEKLSSFDLDYLKSDMRSVNPSMIVAMIRSIPTYHAMHHYHSGQIEESNLVGFFSDEYDVYLASDEVGHKINELYFALANVKVNFVTTFLRWDKLISTQELVVAPDRVISEDDVDREFIKSALIESEKSSDWWRHVGCIAVTKVGKKIPGYNRHMPHEHIPYIEGDVRSNFKPGERNDLGTAIHAEASVISFAAREGIALHDAVMYVTTFPCQNCARLIVNAGIKKVLYKDGYSVQDAERIFKDAGVEIVLVK